MKDAWIVREWKELCRRLDNCAKHCGAQHIDRRDEFIRQAEMFVRAESPERYPQLLERVREAAKLAIRWRQAKTKLHGGPFDCDGDIVEESGVESFPASDPPSWTSASA